jgi:hypothetical protein
MTCQKLRLYFEDPLRSDVQFGVETEHLFRCAECARFVDTQRQMAAGLSRLREAVPQFPERLDASVLANYRGDATSGLPVSKTTGARQSITMLCMTGATAAMVVAIFIFVSTPRAANPIPGPHRAESIAVSQAIARNATPSFLRPAKVRRPHPVRSRRSALPVVAQDSSLAPDFRSLMYCDALSCGGVMELIRVQLPSAGMSPNRASSGRGGTVMADVLVGPDGIARGIRIVE